MVLSRTGVDVMSEQYFTRPNVQPVITNIGTTPEQRQMSTSEFKAKFDEMPEAIQQYIKETLLTELDAFKQEFMTHQAECASKHITESGSNDDGHYIKFDDGTMICYHTTTITYTSAYECLTTWTYPQPFLEGSVISRHGTHLKESNVQRYQVTGVRVSGQTNNPHVGALVRALSYGGHFTSDSSVSVNVFAIGRWK